MRTGLLITDSSPLFSFSYGDCLDLLILPGLPVFLTDQVRWEATRSGNEISRRIAGWLLRADRAVTEVETVIGRLRAAAEASGRMDRRSMQNLGEESVLSAIRTGALPLGPYLFLFEEDRLVDPSFFGRYPVHIVSTMGYLVGLERSGLIGDADAVLARIRGTGRRLKGDIIDRPSRQGGETLWRPPRGAAEPT
jgi:hypothetical protein